LHAIQLAFHLDTGANRIEHDSFTCVEPRQNLDLVSV